jgi:hypothetical protein
VLCFDAEGCSGQRCSAAAFGSRAARCACHVQLHPSCACNCVASGCFIGQGSNCPHQQLCCTCRYSGCCRVAGCDFFVLVCWGMLLFACTEASLLAAAVLNAVVGCCSTREPALTLCCLQSVTVIRVGAHCLGSKPSLMSLPGCQQSLVSLPGALPGVLHLCCVRMCCGVLGCTPQQVVCSRICCYLSGRLW